MKKYRTILLIIIIIVAAGLRLFKLGSVPLSLYWEEAALGYDAYSIAQTGQDMHGNTMPIVAFTSFGDYKPPLYFYTIVPFIKTIGLNAVSVRLPSALAGIATVIVVFFIAEALYGTQIALLASAVLAIQPWSVQLSRVGFETNLATFLIALGVLFLVYARKRSWLLVPAAAVFVLSMYAYHAERIVAPLFALALIFVWKQYKHMKWFVVSGVVAIVMLLPIIINIRNPVITQRAAQTSLFSDPGPVIESNALREEEGNSLISRVFYHRYILFADMMITQYAKNFSPYFFFLEGDGYSRHVTTEFGVLYPWELSCILVAVYLLPRRRYKVSLLPFVWIAIAAIPNSVSSGVDSPHALRFASAAPAFAMLTGYGLYALYQAIRPRFRMLFIVLASVTILVTTTAYLHFYYTHYATHWARDWQYGYKELYTKLADLKKDGQKVYVSHAQGRPSIYYLFFNKIDPALVQAQDATAPKDEQELLQVDDYYFPTKFDVPAGALVGSSPEERNPASPELAHIDLPDGSIIWSIWEKR